MALVPVRGPATAWPRNLVLASRRPGFRVGQLLPTGHGAVHAAGGAELSRAKQRRTPQKEEALEGSGRATLAASWRVPQLPGARAWSSSTSTASATRSYAPQSPGATCRLLRDCCKRKSTQRFHTDAVCPRRRHLRRPESCSAITAKSLPIVGGIRRQIFWWCSDQARRSLRSRTATSPAVCR